MKRYLTILSLLAAVLVLPNVVAAQFSPLSGSGNTVSNANLGVTPTYYEPGDTITITLDAYSLNTAGASTVWLVDGSEVVNAKEQRSLTLTAGALGTNQEVTAVLTLANGSRIEANTTIRPIRIDMLIEADTLTPAFYRGRAMPSNGSTVRVKAVPFVGTSQSARDFSYSWKVGREVIGGGSQIGKDSITFVPGFDKVTAVQVTVFDTAGRTIGTRQVTVPILKPEIHFYEVNPLRGLQTQALGENAPFRGIEMQVRAEPYYVSRGKSADEMHTAWKLNGRTITNPSTDPHQITLRRQGVQGSFNLEFEIRNLSELLQGAKESVSLRF